MSSFQGCPYRGIPLYVMILLNFVTCFPGIKCFSSLILSCVSPNCMKHWKALVPRLAVLMHITGSGHTKVLNYNKRYILVIKLSTYSSELSSHQGRTQSNGPLPWVLVPLISRPMASYLSKLYVSTRRY